MNTPRLRIGSFVKSISFATTLLAVFLIPLNSYAGEDELEETEHKELAEFMTLLSTYTHKLVLSVEAGNSELSDFYLHESEELLNNIQKHIPEYEEIPVASYIDQIGKPSYQPLITLLDDPESFANKANREKAINAVIGGCNACHKASDHGFIKIKNNKNNPFMQTFEP